MLIVNLGAPFRVRAGTDIEPAEYADRRVVIIRTHALEFGYPLRTRCVEVRRRFLREPPGYVLDSWPLPAD